MTEPVLMLTVEPDGASTLHDCPDCKAGVRAVWDGKRGFGFACQCRSIWTNKPYPKMTV